MLERLRSRTGTLLAIPLFLGLPIGPPTLEGTVANLIGGRLIEGVTVELAPSGREAVTNAAGHFSFGTFDSSDTDTLVVTHPDFVPLRLALGQRQEDPRMLRIRLMPRRMAVPDDGAAPGTVR